jgi:hypothetical protein
MTQTPPNSERDLPSTCRSQERARSSVRIASQGLDCYDRARGVQGKLRPNHANMEAK